MPAVPPLVPIYFDSALVAKFYLNEPGREAVRRLASESGVVVTSGIAIAEVSAAFHRKLREGAVDQPTFKALQGHFSTEHLTDLVVTIAFYCAVVRFLATMQVDVEPDYQAYLDRWPLPRD